MSRSPTTIADYDRDEDSDRLYAARRPVRRIRSEADGAAYPPPARGHDSRLPRAGAPREAVPRASAFRLFYAPRRLEN